MSTKKTQPPKDNPGTPTPGNIPRQSPGTSRRDHAQGPSPGTIPRDNPNRAAAPTRCSGGKMREGTGGCPLARDLVHGLGELDVEIGQAAGSVRRQGDVDAVPHVHPFRMMV